MVFAFIYPIIVLVLFVVRVVLFIVGFPFKATRRAYRRRSQIRYRHSASETFGYYPPPRAGYVPVQRGRKAKR